MAHGTTEADGTCRSPGVPVGTGRRTTHFGYRTVPAREKVSLVGGVFDSVAARYDVMNDLMSFGIHRVWKRLTVDAAAVRPGQRVLDVAGGTGDLAKAFSRRVGASGHVVLSDINAAMLGTGRDRLTDDGIVGNVDYALADAEDAAVRRRKLRLRDDRLRAAERDRQAARARLDVPGAQARRAAAGAGVQQAGAAAAGARLRRVLVHGAARSWAGSWRGTPTATGTSPSRSACTRTRTTLEAMMVGAGFERTSYRNMTGGIVALHVGYRL